MSNQSAPPPGKSLLVHIVAKRLGVSRRTVRWWAETGRVPAHRKGIKLWQIDEAVVNALAESRGGEGV